MTYDQAIYYSLPDDFKLQFTLDVVLYVSRLIEEIEFKYPLLSNQEKVFFTTMGNASKDGDYGAVYEAFGKVLSE
jgi:hypothetical protein